MNGYPDMKSINKRWGGGRKRYGKAIQTLLRTYVVLSASTVNASAVTLRPSCTEEHDTCKNALGTAHSTIITTYDNFLKMVHI